MPIGGRLPHRVTRDHSLLALLPPKDSPYSFDSLSQTETAALEAAFGDGFGDVGAFDSRALPLPREIRSGLLGHAFFVQTLRNTILRNIQMSSGARTTIDRALPKAFRWASS